MKKWSVEKESVVGGEVDNAHNLVAERHVFVEESVGPINVVKGSKPSSGQPMVFIKLSFQIYYSLVYLV